MSSHSKAKRPPARNGRFIVEFFECAVYFWLLDNFFIQELPLYYDAKALVSMIL